MIKMNKAEMSLETIAKAVLVLALIVIVLIVMRNLIVGGGESIEDTGKGITDQIDNCVDNPDAEGCDNWFRGDKTQNGDFPIERNTGE